MKKGESTAVFRTAEIGFPSDCGRRRRNVRGACAVLIFE